MGVEAPAARPKMPFVPELDGVRAIAVLIVFIAHVGLGYLVPGGFGVTVFFFLSGYLITSLLRAEVAETGRVDLPAFYLRRTLRIFPPLYLTMLLSAAVVASGVLKSTIDPGSVFAQALFVSNYNRLWGPHDGLPGLPLWSLAVEEHFYLLFPLAFGLLSRRLSSARIAAVCALACVAPLLFRLAHAWAGDVRLNYFFTHTRVDSILFGCVLALWSNPILDRGRGWAPTRAHSVFALLMLAAATAWPGDLYAETIRYTLQGLCLFVLFARVLRPDPLTSRVLNSAPAQWLGRFSYTFYLSHMIFIAILRHAGCSWPTTALIAFVATIGYSAVMYWLVEKPLGAVRRRLQHDCVISAAAAPRSTALEVLSPTAMAEPQNA